MKFLKALTRWVSFLSFLFCLGGCAKYAASDSGRVVEIFSAVKIDNGYVYSEESIFEVGGVKYLLRHKAVYGTDGVVEQFLSYKPEGVIKYDKEELLRDKKIVDSAGLPFGQKWTYKSSYLDADDRHIEVREIMRHLLMHEGEGNRVLFYVVRFKEH